MISLWLDDVRPAPEGWTWVKTVEEAKALLETGTVQRASLDHDLGACVDCIMGKGIVGTLEEVQHIWLEQHNYQSMPHCEHFGSGYTLVCWMEETGKWPQEKPTVHSRNPAGRLKMELAINREWQRRG